jgi:anaerobic selenocysteine-containing dehydrogenase
MEHAAEATHHHICPLCEACCGLEIKVRDHQVISIRGHDADVFSAGYICPKGVALKDLHEDPDRLRTPLVKRNGVFEKASWDEAWAEIERRLPPILQAHGRNAAGLVIGNPAAHKIGLLTTIPRLAKALGTHNVFTAATLDQIPRHVSSGLLFGHWMSVPVPDIARCELLIVLGANPVVSNASMWTVPDFRGKAKAMQARGGRLVVIDPRRTETAAMADTHHFIRPGGDAFLLLGMVHTLFAENLVRLGRMAEHVTGVQDIAQAVAAFSPEAVAARCGMDAGTVRELARSLAASPRASIYARIGACTQEYGSLSTWLVDVLNTLTGHLDEPGGAMFPKAAAFAGNTSGKPGSGRGVATGRHKSRVSGAPEVMGELPIGCLMEEIETPGTGQIRALVTLATNPVLSAPNGARLSRALEGLDFMVSLDIYVNETSRHADVILPPPSPLEDLHYDVPFPQLSWRNHARYSAPVFMRDAAQPAEWETLLRLAAIVSGKHPGQSAAEIDDENFAEDARKLFGDGAAAVLEATAGLRGPDRLLDVALRTGPYGDQFGKQPGGLNLARVQASSAAGGIDLGALAPRIPELLRTPSGRVELAPVMLLNDVLRAQADLARAPSPMVVIGRRDVRSNNSWMHNLPVLAKGPMRCTALVHPADAQRLGLRDGAMARISSHSSQGPRSIEVQVHCSADMMPGVVSVPHGWGHDQPGAQLALAASRPGANLNHLLDENLRDPLSGNAVLSGVAVEMCAVD